MTFLGSAARLATRRICALAAATLFTGPWLSAMAPVGTGHGTTLDNSIRAVPASPTDANGHRNRAFISRASLQPDEAAAPMKFEVVLAMRNFDELEARLAHSEIVSPAELEGRYLPLATDYQKVRQWLESAGMTITRTDANRLAVFAQASVSDVSNTLQTAFARVTTSEGEFTSAVTAPTVPNHIASVIRGIHGLQPHIRMRIHPQTLQAFAGTGSSIPYYPAQIAQAYSANSLGLNGSGQTIAVYAVAVPTNSDLTTFWNTTGAGASLSNIETVNVAGGPATNTSTTSLQEATLDVEWSSAMAPGAKIRVYAANENDPVADDELIQEILADLPTHPTLHQLSISFGIEESSADRDYIAIEAQYMATLVSSGVTVFAASGDTGAADSSGKIETWFPASMPDVTAVGGTSLRLDASSNILSETAWGTLTDTGLKSGASGGGISAIFSRPSWQNVAGTPSGTMRLVPDVACVADPSTGGMVVYNGKSLQFGGTSLATPIWAAWCAMMNQGRAAAGKVPLGALNPRLYAFAGTSLFHDITSGGNSVYQAGVGYDLVTGIGSPNVAAIYQATLSDTFSPVIEVQSGDRFTTPAQSTTFYVVATGSPTPSFQWQRLPAGSSTWTNVTESSTYTGSTTFALSVVGATTAMNLDQFRCVISNSLGSITSTASTLTVGAYGVTTLAGWPGWSGYADGQGSNSRFNFVGSVRTDPTGTIWVCDASNNTIRKVTPAGVVTTYAGSPGVAGSTDGTTSAARFNGPAGVGIDAAGNIYVAEAQNYTIRKITPAGIVSTLAGTAGVRGHADGTGAAASFYDPENLALDSAGNIYVADGLGNSVRKVTPAGVVTTLAGSATAGSADGTGSSARFDFLAGIAVDSTGNVYVGDFNNCTVRKINAAGTVTTLAGTAGVAGFLDGTGASARFKGPSGMAVDGAGNLFVADQANNAIRKITPSGTVTTLAGTTTAENIDGPLASARFNFPADVAIDSNGIMYIADGMNCTVRRITFAPAIAVAPLSQHVVTGNSFTLSVAMTGTGPFAYQWFKDGTAISGATSASYTVAAATSANSGSYTVQITTPAGTVTSSAAAVSVTSTSDSRLVNLSVRALAGTGANTLTVGFVVNGTTSKYVLLRGVGPGLVPLGVSSSDVLPDPVLTTFGPDSQTLVAVTNNNWNSSDATGMAALGAFPLTAGSTDAAAFATLAPGTQVQTQYTTQVVDSAGRSGVALAEVYDAATTSAARLVNISGRSYVGTDANVMIAGFIIRGTDAKRVLIRGAGPSLTLLQVPDTSVLHNPRLDLYDGNNVVIQSNDDWGGSQTLSTAFNSVGAFGFSGSTSKDAAMIVQLPPGSYTAELSGVNGDTGVGLIEIYELPTP